MGIVAELADLEAGTESAPENDATRLAASGPRDAAMAGAIPSVVLRRSAHLRANRREGAVVGVVIAWAIAAGLTALGWL